MSESETDEAGSAVVEVTGLGTEPIVAASSNVVETPPHPFHAWLRDFRLSLSMSQERLANELCTTVSTINRWERGHALPSRIGYELITRFATKRGSTPPARGLVVDTRRRGSG